MIFHSNENSIAISLNEDIVIGLENGYIKAKDMVKFILDNTNSTIDKNLEEASLSDIRINGSKISSCYINRESKEIILRMEE